MQHSVAVGEIENRARFLNLHLKGLARRAGLHPSTAYRGTKPGAEMRLSTFGRLTDALEAEEKRLLAHLVACHPQAALELATVALCPARQAGANGIPAAADAGVAA